MVTAFSEGILPFSIPTHRWHSVNAATCTSCKTFSSKAEGHLEYDLADARTQVSEHHLAGDWGDGVNHLVGQLKACLPINFSCERLVIVQGVRVADAVVVNLLNFKVGLEKEASRTCWMMCFSILLLGRFPSLPVTFSFPALSSSRSLTWQRVHPLLYQAPYWTEVSLTALL